MRSITTYITQSIVMLYRNYLTADVNSFFRDISNTQEYIDRKQNFEDNYTKAKIFMHAVEKRMCDQENDINVFRNKSDKNFDDLITYMCRNGTTEYLEDQFNMQLFFYSDTIIDNMDKFIQGSNKKDLIMNEELNLDYKYERKMRTLYEKSRKRIEKVNSQCYAYLNENCDDVFERLGSIQQYKISIDESVYESHIQHNLSMLIKYVETCDKNSPISKSESENDAYSACLTSNEDHSFTFLLNILKSLKLELDSYIQNVILSKLIDDKYHKLEELVNWEAKRELHERKLISKIDIFLEKSNNYVYRFLNYLCKCNSDNCKNSDKEAKCSPFMNLISYNIFLQKIIRVDPYKILMTEKEDRLKMLKSYFKNESIEVYIENCKINIVDRHLKKNFLMLVFLNYTR